LREQEGVLLAQLDRAHGQLAEERREYVSSVSQRKSLLDTLIAEIEKKRNQPVVEFLMVRLHHPPRCEAAKAPIPEPVSPELQRTVESLCETSQLVVEAVATFRGKAETWRVMLVLVKVTLDPETASPYLSLSEDLRTVRLGDGQQDLPDNPKRWTGSASVLGSQG
ncbi:TRI15 protein, partial [Bucorvus abyssinicus]|nr:TRI15 protein [Bucorvus abyssinicus]